MEETSNKLNPIPVSFVVDAGLHAPATEAKRQPYISLISDWAVSEGRAAAAEPYVNQLQPGKKHEKQQDGRELRKLLKPNYRDEHSIQTLKEILEEADNGIVNNPGTWTWAHVMRVMTDAGILGTNIVSQFDNLICWLLPDKKKDSVRKSGKYIIMMTDRPWHRWQGDGSSVKEGESHHIMMCKQISKLFEPLTIKA